MINKNKLPNLIVKKEGTWLRTDFSDKSMCKYYRSLCIGCLIEIRARSSVIKFHSNRCRKCNNKYIQANRLEYKLKKLKNKKLMENKMKKIKLVRDQKQQSFGCKLKLWDNSLSNTVKDFNLIFDEYLGDNPDLEIEIFEPFTENGRIIQIQGKQREQFLFNDENNYEWYGYYFDVIDATTNNFIKRYKQVVTICRDYNMTTGTVYAMANHNSTIKLENGRTIKINKIDNKIELDK